MFCPADALFQLAKKANVTGEMDCAPVPPAPQVFLGEQYVNNPTLSDVTFLVQVRIYKEPPSTDVLLVRRPLSSYQRFVLHTAEHCTCASPPAHLSHNPRLWQSSHKEHSRCYPWDSVD